MSMKGNKKETRKTVPVFFAADENYMPFLAVALTSMKAKLSKEYLYQIHVLYTGKLCKNAKTVKEMETENFRIHFVDISEKIDAITHLIHCRDYYTSAIYYRLFIPELFPQYEKAIYLDCDTVVLRDIAELYEIDIKDNFIGAVADQAVAAIAPFREYTKYALGIESEKYFNSGVIVMNLEQMRAIRFYDVFSKILGSYDFIVAPDQDCLNLICKDKVYYLEATWNTMPTGAIADEGNLKLVHYNLSMKPWHYDNVLYQNYFWDFAKQTPFYAAIVAKRAAFTAKDAKRDEEEGERLIALAQAEADSPCNYLCSQEKKRKNQVQETENEGGRYGFIEGFTRKTSGIKAD